MNTHYRIYLTDEMVKGTDKYPANSGLYHVTFGDGTEREEWYTVAFGWNNSGIENRIVKSKFLKPFEKFLKC